MALLGCTKLTAPPVARSPRFPRLRGTRENGGGKKPGLDTFRLWEGELGRLIEFTIMAGKSFDEAGVRHSYYKDVSALPLYGRGITRMARQRCISIFGGNDLVAGVNPIESFRGLMYTAMRGTVY